MPAVRRTVDDRGVATLTIDHPPINLMTIELFASLARHVAELGADDDVRAVVLRSSVPGWFIAHFDVAAILGFPQDAPPPSGLNAFHRMCETLRTMPKPTVAVVDGRVGGGGNEVAMSCDMRFATTRSTICQPEVPLGIIPGGSGTVRLPRLVGRGRALEIVLGGDDIDAVTAERWGLVNRVLEPGEIDGFVERLVGRITSFPGAAVAAAKAAVLHADHAIDGQLLAEGRIFNGLLADPEARAAMQRFLDHGGQTPDGERDLGRLVADIHRTPLGDSGVE